MIKPDNDHLNQLAKEAKAGDQQAFGQLFDLLADSVYRFLASRIRDEATAQDLTSEVFLEAWQGIARYDENRSFKTWLFSIARYNLIDHYRRHRPTVSLDAVIERSGGSDIRAEAEVKSDVDRVLVHLHHLPELYQTVLTLKYIDELDYPEIVAITGKTENYLRVIVKRGLDRLRTDLDQ